MSANKDELCCVYAILILHDSGAEITSDKLNELISASGNTVEAYWPPLFAGLCSKVDVGTLISESVRVGGGGGSGSGGDSAGEAAAKEDTKEEEVQEEEEEIDLGGGGMFGDAEAY